MRTASASAAAAASRPVVLVHGLWMSRHAMLWLEYWFRRRGYAAASRGYASVRKPLDDNAAALARLFEATGSGARDVVCHSYGGVVVLRMLDLGLGPPVRRLVLLGSPVRGSAVGRRLAEHPAGPWLLGRTAGLWRTGQALTIPPGLEVGAIAGSRPIGMGRLLAKVEGLNDGVVAVDETRLDGMADHLIVDCAHSGMLLSPEVAGQAEHFLRCGAFAR